MSESPNEGLTVVGVGRGLVFLVLGAVILALANLFVPFLAPVIAPGLGLLAFQLLFRVPGRATWRRDLALGIGILLVFLVAWAAKALICEAASTRVVACGPNRLMADLFLNLFCLMPPVFLIWSYVRYRSLKHKILGKNEEELLDL